MSDERRSCELAWLVPVWRRNRPVIIGGTDSERSQIVHSADELITAIRQINREVWEEFGLWVAVTMEGLSDPSLDATIVEDRWHFWYLAEEGDVSLVSVGEAQEPGETPVIFSDFDRIQNAELVPDDVGEVVVREWYENKALSDKIRWRTR